MHDADILTRERLALIETRLAADGRIVAAKLATELAVSVDTIRRDLRELAAEGRCRRVYGGALPAAPQPGNHQQRLTYMAERKQRLAQAASSIIRPGMTVYVDAGTTNLAIVRALPADIPLTLITNAPAIAAFALDRPRWTLILLGGVVDLATGAAVGSVAMRDAAALIPDLAIIGTCGFDTEAGLTAHTLDEAELKRLVCRQARMIAAALTDDKLTTSAPYRVLSAQECQYLILEATAPAELVSSVRSLGVEVLLADAMPDTPEKSHD